MAALCRSCCLGWQKRSPQTQDNNLGSKGWEEMPYWSTQIRKLNTSRPKPGRLIIPSAHSHSEGPGRFVTGRTASAFAELEQRSDLKICTDCQQPRRKGGAWIFKIQV